MKNSYAITLKIKRYDPDSKKSWVQDYELEAGRILRFTDVFRKINNELDPSLAWNSSCEHAQCGTCAVRVNGKPLLACELLVENAVARFGTTVFEVGPITVAPVVRDLVVDFEQAYERVNKVKPYIIEPAQNLNPGEEYQIDPRDLERYVE
ncbi:MAG: succinate dehydrogenase/fumarate reductase iron-sulfur subunit, partial [Gammaproteobacteria bacterium]|nr:succinate dehydrogenase/fumarate reductase iron-sulfur subunit [Gammaproteobacteria bacterium]